MKRPENATFLAATVIAGALTSTAAVIHVNAGPHPATGEPPTNGTAMTRAVHLGQPGETALVLYADTQDILTTAAGAGQFETLVAAVKAAGLEEALSGDGPFTVFAPTDEAFARLPEGTVEQLLKPENRESLAAILKYHVLPRSLESSEVARTAGAITLQGQRLAFSLDGRSVMVDRANVVSADIRCTNGVIHVIDRVILPEMRGITEVAEAAGSFTTLLAAVEAAGLLDALTSKGPFTVFAPTDEAFAKLPAETLRELLMPESRGRLAAILKHHVVPGRVYSAEALKAGSARTLGETRIDIAARNDSVRIGESSLLHADINAANGVIHVIDTVLLPE